MNDKIKISGVGGDVVGVGVSGTGNIVGKNITISGGITLNAQQLAKLPNEYAASLKSFSEAVNEQLKAHNVPQEKIAPVQQEVEALAKEVEAVKPGEAVRFTQKSSITSRVANIAKGLLKILPNTAETIASFTPLAPFGKLIGTGVSEIIKAVQSEG